MHPPFFQGVLVPLNMTNPVRFMTNPCLTNPLLFYQDQEDGYPIIRVEQTGFL